MNVFDINNYCIVECILKYLPIHDKVNFLIANDIIEDTTKYIVKRYLFGSRMKNYKYSHLTKLNLEETNPHTIDWFKLINCRKLKKDEITKFIMFIPIKSLDKYYSKDELENFRLIQNVACRQHFAQPTQPCGQIFHF